MNPKMKDIASRANVSVSTVSKIINKETEKKISERKPWIGYKKL